MEQYINATRILNNIDAALKVVPPRANGKSERFLTNFVTLGVVKNMIQDEIQHREFRPVVHAHWIDDYGNSACSECGCICIEVDENYWRNDRKVMFCPYCGAIMDEEVK